MIVRKPYAFLIKYFKIIHIVLFVFMTYFLFKVRNIYEFFRNYLSTGTYTYVSDMVYKYINIPMILISILLIVFLLLIYFLMKQKQKPVFYYLMATIFYIVLFASFLFLMSVFSNLEFKAYSNQALVLFRDLTMILYLFHFLFIPIAFARGFGFNVKKFNFERDIKELDITEADREEIEVGALVDYENVSNFFRKEKRQFKYYLKENSFILIVFLVFLILAFTSYFTIDRLVIHKTYHEREKLVLNKLEYVINSSYITNKDKDGEFIKNKNTYYLVVNFSVLNQKEENLQLEIDNYRVKIDKEYYYPVKNLSKKFEDLGVVYKSQKLISKKTNDYLFVFEIGKYENKKITLELYNYKKVVNGEAVLYYKDVRLTPDFYKEENLGAYKLMDSVSLKKTYLKDGTFSISKYEFLDVVEYTYTKCDNTLSEGKCVDYKASVVPRVGKKLLKIEYTTSIEKKDIFSYLNLKGMKNGREYLVGAEEIKNVTPDNYTENVVLLEIPSDVATASNIRFVFDIRGVSFEYETI